MSALMDRLDAQEFEIDVLDAAGVSVDAASDTVTLTPTLGASSWLCVSATAVSLTATYYYGCVGA